MHYILNKGLFKTAMTRLGYENVLDFSRKTSVHRSTILGYLSGKSIFLPSFSKIAESLNMDPLDLIIAVSEPAANIQDIKEIAQIIAAISKYDKNIAAVLLGSRVKGLAKKYSDWDIGITRGQRSITGVEYLKLKGRVEELSEDIPRIVDLLNLDAAPVWFLKSIDYEPIFLDGSKESYLYFRGVLNGINKRE